jgi:hypothetical protein
MSGLDDQLKIAQIEHTMRATENLKPTADLMRAESEKLKAERSKLDREKWLAVILGVMATLGTFMGGLAAIILAWKH